MNLPDFYYVERNCMEAFHNLTHIEFRVLHGLLSFANKQGRCWPSARQIGERIGVVQRRTVYRALQGLKEKGVISWKTLQDEPGRTYNMYLVLPRVKARRGGEGAGDATTPTPPHSDTTLVANTHGAGVDATAQTVTMNSTTNRTRKKPAQGPDGPAEDEPRHEDYDSLWLEELEKIKANANLSEGKTDSSSAKDYSDSQTTEEQRRSPAGSIPVDTGIIDNEVADSVSLHLDKDDVPSDLTSDPGPSFPAPSAFEAPRNQPEPTPSDVLPWWNRLAIKLDLPYQQTLHPKTQAVIQRALESGFWDSRVAVEIGLQRLRWLEKLQSDGLPWLFRRTVKGEPIWRWLLRGRRNVPTGCRRVVY